MQRAHGWVVALWCLVGLAACAEKEGVTPQQREKAAQWVSKTATTPSHPLDLKFGDYVTLIGYDAKDDKLTPGKPATITWHWRVDKQLPAGFRPFTHLADALNVSRVNLDSTGDLRQNLPPEYWEAGTYVRDAQVVQLAKDWSSPTVTLYVGFWKGDERLAVVGPQDDERRGRALSLDVSVAAQQLLQAHASHASMPIVLNGKLDEAAWSGAISTSRFVNTMSGASAEPKVSVKTLWDDQHLYVAFDVADDFLKSTFTEHDDHLWKQDCVEIMLDPDGDGKNYFELQVAPSNKTFDTRYDTRRNPTPFGHVDWESELRSGVALRGTLNDTQPDDGYTVELAIPWRALAKGTPAHEPPKAGDVWRINFFLMDERQTGQRAVGWSAPRVGDFHVPQRFGRLTFDPPSEPPAAVSEAKRESVSKQPGERKAVKQGTEAKAVKQGTEAKAVRQAPTSQPAP